MYDNGIEKQNDCSTGGIAMNAWSFFFILIGVCFMTAQLFRVIDMIEHPRHRSNRRSAARS